MTFSTVIYQKERGVARVILNRPEVLNVYNIRMRDELFEVFSAIREDDDIAVIVLSGSGRAFCAGADLTEFGTAPSPTIARQVRFARDVWAVLDSVPVPKVALLHGYAFGSGLELAMFCDLRLAAAKTLLGLPETHLGMIPAAGATQTVARACGVSTALDMLLTGRRVDAAEALQIGLVSQVVDPGALEGAGEAVVSRIQRIDTRAVRALMRALREGADLSLDQALHLEGRLAALLGS